MVIVVSLPKVFQNVIVGIIGAYISYKCKQIGMATQRWRKRREFFHHLWADWFRCNLEEPSSWNGRCSVNSSTLDAHLRCASWSRKRILKFTGAKLNSSSESVPIAGPLPGKAPKDSSLRVDDEQTYEHCSIYGAAATAGWLGSCLKEATEVLPWSW